LALPDASSVVTVIAYTVQPVRISASGDQYTPALYHTVLPLSFLAAHLPATAKLPRRTRYTGFESHIFLFVCLRMTIELYRICFFIENTLHPNQLIRQILNKRRFILIKEAFRQAKPGLER
jgi:hypothetical protein